MEALSRLTRRPAQPEPVGVPDPVGEGVSVGVGVGVVVGLWVVVVGLGVGVVGGTDGVVDVVVGWPGGLLLVVEDVVVRTN